MRPEVMEQLREAHDIYSLTRGINGSAWLDIPVGDEFGGAEQIASRPIHPLRRETTVQVSS